VTTSSIAERLGCKLLRGQGSERLWECGDPARVVALLRELAADDVSLPAVQTLARELVRAFGTNARTLAEELHAYVLATVEWRREGVETFQSSAETLKCRYGDCDDHARLIFAVLSALRIPARLEILDNEKGEPAHAVTRALVGGRWTWLETSVPARFGEAPLAAAKRLGMHTRLNMPPGLSGLAGLGDLVVNNGTPAFTGPAGVDIITGAAVGAALLSPLGTAIGAVVGLAGGKGLGHGASVGSGIGALVGATAGAVFAARSRVAAPTPAAPVAGGS